MVSGDSLEFGRSETILSPIDYTVLFNIFVVTIAYNKKGKWFIPKIPSLKAVGKGTRKVTETVPSRHLKIVYIINKR